MTSLRLAEALLRAVAHEGHQIRDLDSLRAHMSGEHGLDVAGMLPQKVLLNLHEKDHSGTEWHGSSDASRSPGYVAARGGGMFWRREANWQKQVLPGDSISQHEQASRLSAMREHMRGLGFPVEDVDAQSNPNHAPMFSLADSGHQVVLGHSRKDQTWVARVHHPDDNGPEKTIATVNLGTNTEHTVPLLVRELGRQPVTGELMRQWSRASAGRHEYPGPRRPRDWGPHAVHFTARGAELPEQHEDDGWI